MRLSKLKLAGFKSFVDPTVVITPGQLVGIVGPNGCGKSNLIDAVRWVLGESRASALRGESMQDVIFSGSNTRKPVSRASVELVFDNADGRAAGQWSPYAEIAVKRVVDRNGDSEYYINNVRVRRKDVIDLFLGTGLGPRAYAIIEQGMISRVIEARPEDVRAFLEEAAGVTKYKERRRETEGRLSDARDNLARVEDIRAELGLQIERLFGQAELARRYKDLSSTLGQRQVLLWRFKHTQAEQELAKLHDVVIELAASIESSSASLHETDHQLVVAREHQQVLSEVLNAAQRDFYAITAEVSRVESEIKALRDTHARLSQRGTQLLAEEAQWREREARLHDEQAVWEERRAIALERLEIVQDSAGESEFRVPEAESLWQQARNQLEVRRRSHAQAEQQVRVAEAKRTASARALESLAQRRERLEVERQGLNPADEQALATLESEVAELSARQHEEEARSEALQEQGEQALDHLRQVRQQTEQLGKDITQRHARLDALRGLQARLQGQGDLADWLKSLGLDDEQPLWQSLHVEAGWELAVESILRERVAALGPFDDARIAASLEQPSPANMVLLRPLEDVPPPSATHFTARSLFSLVRCEREDIAMHLRYWLNGFYAVEDLDSWLQSGQNVPPGVTLVSQSGQALSVGALTLFAPDARTHGALERQREIDSLEAELVPAEDALALAQEALAEADRRFRALQDEQVESRQRVKQAQARLHERTLDFVKAQQEQARHEERLSQLAREVAELAAQETLEQAHLAEAELAGAEAEAQMELLFEQVQEAQQQVDQSEQALRAVREAHAGIQRQRQEAEFAVRESEVKLGDIERSLALMTSEREKNAAEQARLSQEQGSLDEGSVQTALQTALDLRHQREEALNARRGELEEAQQRLRSLEENRTRLDHALGPMRDKINEMRLQSQAAELARDQARERLGELGAEVIALEPAVMADVKEASLSREVSRLTREIAEMGPVNLAALVELEAARERKRFLDMQYEDLMGAIDTLESAIRKIDKDTREQLKTTYETVNRHFGELFPRLFGGGEAQLVLAGEEILDSGVNIVARPPGKKNSSIHLLSGGEKALTAIALVFAMFQLNPAPFCMLDEVDAPLDDANTERYCDMVKHMSAVTQFVFISHSKITMEMAQQLVGVTMQEQGVSRVVEVDMEEALKLAQPVAA